jgi:rubrerythrin
MKTSEQWWNEVKNDQTKLHEWLLKQYHGELTAAQRIFDMQFDDTSPDHAGVLAKISLQESTHASWVADLLVSRGIDPNDHTGTMRYWNQVEDAAISFESKAAIATLAEGMRLERIRVIAADEDAPEDIRNVFRLILVDEEWHEKAFASMTNQESIEAVRPFHNLGKEVLGLEA